MRASACSPPPNCCSAVITRTPRCQFRRGGRGGKLRGFDAETTLHALAIALSHVSGTTEYTSTGGSIKRIHAGIGTRNGMAAADMAQAGISGPARS